ncbi:MAG: T9SS type A sorting domain-containing protein [Saprospiraceae bacterium]|nr:T9SS type A sorting domain-containing protein [Saprospiraceae bacterium]
MSGTNVLPYARFGGFSFNGGYGGPWNEAIGSRNLMADGMPGNAPFARWNALAPGTTRFLGVKGTMAGGGTHYAWVRITFYSVNHIVIHDWAYESNPDVGITAGEAPLPIELTHFAASVQVQDVQLRWQTASEQNNAGFDIQRSEDGTSFRSLAWVEGKGTTTDLQEYLYDDKNLREGMTYYYRLRQVDYDGQFDFSPVVTVTVGGKGAVAGEFYPNPTEGGTVRLDFTAKEDSEWKVSVFDAVGNLTSFEELSNINIAEGSTTLSFDFTGLPSGVYFVKMDNGAERIYRKLVVERLRD